MSRNGSIDHALASVLRRLREQHGISQERIAQGAQITTGSYARIELGQAAPGWWTVRQIAAALGLTVAELAAMVEDHEQA